MSCRRDTVSRGVAFAFSPRTIVEFDPHCLENAFKSCERRVSARRQRTVECLSVYSGSRRHLADFVSLGDITQRQHEHILGLFPRGIYISSNVLWIL